MAATQGTATDIKAKQIAGKLAGPEDDKLTRKRPTLGHDFRLISVLPPRQADSLVSQPDDPAEQAAEHLADDIMRMQAPTPAGRHSAPAARRAAEGTSPVVDASANLIVQAGIQDGGQPLSPETRAFMEPRFGHDFSRVRVHASERAERSAHALDALAYTSGRNIVFRSGQYAPGTTRGQRLLAHELAHVVQQDNCSTARAVRPTNTPFNSKVIYRQAVTRGHPNWTPGARRVREAIQRATGSQDIEAVLSQLRQAGRQVENNPDATRMVTLMLDVPVEIASYEITPLYQEAQRAAGITQPSVRQPQPRLPEVEGHPPQVMVQPEPPETLRNMSAAVFMEGYPEGSLARRLIGHYSRGHGAEYRLHRDEMEQCQANINLNSELMNPDFHRLLRFLSPAGGGHVTFSGLASCLAAGTLGRFTIHYDGEVQIDEEGGWRFNGTMHWYDLWDFDPQPFQPNTPGARSTHGEVLVRSASYLLAGRPFDITSDTVSVSQTSEQERAEWLGGGVHRPPQSVPSRVITEQREVE